MATRRGRSPDGGDGGEGARFERAAEMLRALSHPARLRIVDLLAHGELCVKSMEEMLCMAQPSVSQHLSRLRYAGLIESERRGHLVCYRLTEERARRIVRAALGEAGDPRGGIDDRAEPKGD